MIDNHLAMVAPCSGQMEGTLKCDTSDAEAEVVNAFASSVGSPSVDDDANKREAEGTTTNGSTSSPNEASSSVPAERSMSWDEDEQAPSSSTREENPPTPSEPPPNQDSEMEDVEEDEPKPLSLTVKAPQDRDMPAPIALTPRNGKVPHQGSQSRTSPRPTSSSSSRSSCYSPTQSPLLQRVSTPMYTAPTASTTLYSPASSPGVHLRNLTVCSTPDTSTHSQVTPQATEAGQHIFTMGDFAAAALKVAQAQGVIVGGMSSTASSTSDESNDFLHGSQDMDQATGFPQALFNAAGGFSRQQLLSGPCPVCGDRISGFHYGIFSCESCKGFFKRTVQNKKHYVCLRGGQCTVQVATRKKCPACRFDKCLKCGMKLEAIREDRTRGGRSTYQCSYAFPPLTTPPHGLPPTNANASTQSAQSGDPSPLRSSSAQEHRDQEPIALVQKSNSVKIARTSQSSISSSEPRVASSVKHSNGSHPGLPPLSSDLQRELHYPLNMSSHNMNQAVGAGGAGAGAVLVHSLQRRDSAGSATLPGEEASNEPGIPQLIQDILSVEHLWHYSEKEKLQQKENSVQECNGDLLRGDLTIDDPSTGATNDLLGSLCNIADHRLYKIVKWCKSLPLFRDITVDDQIALLINSWCELLLLSCCFRSMVSEGELRVSRGRSVTLCQAQACGMGPVVERMLNLTELLRRLRVDHCEFVCLKVIVLLTSDASGLKESEKVRVCKKQVLEALQNYTISHYPSNPAKFGELLLCIPELERACQISKESLAASRQAKSRGDAAPGFNLLMELLRGDH